MVLHQLSLTNYRNFEQATYSLPPEGTAIRGSNGRGKSNILESIFFLVIAKSARGANDRDIVRWGADSFSIAGCVEREGQEVSLRVAFDARLQKKKAFVDEEPLPRLAGLVGQFNAVLFSPEDVDLVLRTPAERRRLLDILISQSSPSYLSDLETYRRVLAQRNRLLKDAGRRLLDDPSALIAWDGQLAESGARVISDRMVALEDLKLRVGAFYETISSSGESLTLSYRGTAGAVGGELRAATLAETLRSKCEDEVRVGHTLSGPHRDQLVFEIDGRPVHQFGSKGQMKSALLSWKLAEAAYLEARVGSKPVLLMDDIFSELDATRARAVLELVSNFGQVVLTTARDPDLALGKKSFGCIEL